MGIANEVTQAVAKALEQYGFHNGRYGELPYEVRCTNMSSSGPTASTKGPYYGGVVKVDGRVIAYFDIYAPDVVQIHMCLGEWLNPRKEKFSLNPTGWGVPFTDAPKVKYEDLQFKKYPVFDRAAERASIAMAMISTAKIVLNKKGLV